MDSIEKRLQEILTFPNQFLYDSFLEEKKKKLQAVTQCY